MKRMEDKVICYLYISNNKTLDEILYYTKISYLFLLVIVNDLYKKGLIEKINNIYSLNSKGKLELFKNIKSNKELEELQIRYAQDMNYNIDNFKAYLEYKRDLELLSYEEFIIINNLVYENEEDNIIKYEKYIGVYDEEIILNYLEFKNYCYTNDLEIYNYNYVKAM